MTDSDLIERLRALLADHDKWRQQAQYETEVAQAAMERVKELEAERDAMKAALEEALIWHEAQDKAISKQPNANTGHNGWMRAQHQEQAALIRAALAQGQEAGMVEAVRDGT